MKIHSHTRKRTFFDEENVRKLAPADARRYLTTLGRRIELLSEILAREDAPTLTDTLQKLTNTLEIMRAKHEIEGQDRINFSLTIDPTESGFPTVTDFYMLERDKRVAQEALEILSNRETLVDKIRGAIMRGGSLIEPQTQLRRFKLYSMLNETDLVQEFDAQPPKLIEESDQERKYAIEWACIERGTNVPVLYRLCLTQDRTDPPLHTHPNDALKTFVYQSQSGSLDIRTWISTVDKQLPFIHPKMIDKYVIGPFFDANPVISDDYESITVNSPALLAALQYADNKSVLKFRRESVVSVGQRKVKRGWFSGFIRGPKYYDEFGDRDTLDVRMIAPHRTKQRLGDYDEFGNPCKVYGATLEGGVIG